MSPSTPRVRVPEFMSTLGRGLGLSGMCTTLILHLKNGKAVTTGLSQTLERRALL